MLSWFMVSEGSDGGRVCWARAVHVIIWWLEDKDERTRSQKRKQFPNHALRDTPLERPTSYSLSISS